MNDLEKRYENCIECGKCTESCLFLKKYNINLKDYARMPELAYHCFLCGKCRRECPVDIDGRQISLDLRKQQLKQGYRLRRNGYGLLLAEKQNFIFKNYRHVNSKVVLFPGCNFPAYYPKSIKALSLLLAKQFGISTVYDCCGKPISELGLSNDDKTITDRLNKRFQKLGIEEIIVVCPNCYYHFKTGLGVKVSSIYQKLKELQIPVNEDIVDISVFMPCPDRETHELLDVVSEFVPSGQMKIVQGIQCCGAGGCAAVKEPEIVCQLGDQFQSQASKTIHTYCATCSGMIAKFDVDTEHILSRLLNIDERPAKGRASLLNRIKYKWSR